MKGISAPPHDHVPVLCTKARPRIAEAKAYRNEGELVKEETRLTVT